MNINLNKISKYLACLSSISFLLVFSAVAHGVVLRINPDQSHVRYASTALSCTPDGGCATMAPVDYNIRGNIAVTLIPEHWDFGPSYGIVDRTIIDIESSQLESGALALGFYLDRPNGVLGLVLDSTFEVRDDPCFLFIGPGSCSGWVIGTRTRSTGSWDGETLHWTGIQNALFERFEFSISANAVPIPGTLALLLVALIGMSVVIQSKIRGISKIE